VTESQAMTSLRLGANPDACYGLKVFLSEIDLGGFGDLGEWCMFVGENK